MTEQNVDPKIEDQNLNENQASEKKGLGGFMKGFNKFTSKIQEKTKNIGNPLDNVVGKVTGVIDKIEKKIEEVSGVDLDSLATMPKQEEKKSDEKPVDELETKDGTK
ncbi:MAG TPA: hypothetical protein PLP73_02425 [Candidatus Absconditabacterales bacterium]|nr:hypothetical protein [Candidatus Absconditabacterales bacterium]